MRRAGFAAAAVLAVVLAGCGGGAPYSSDAFTQRAEEVIAAWSASAMQAAWQTGFVPLAEPRHIDDGGRSIYRTDDVELQSNAKRALEAGVYQLAPRALDSIAVPDGEGEISFPDASTMAVRLIGAAEAFGELQTTDTPVDCTGGGCVLTVTGARLGTMPLATSRGEATVPAWQFDVAELTVPVFLLAVAPSVITPLPEPAIEPEGDLTAVDGVTAGGVPARSATTLTVHYGTGACLDWYTALVYESSGAVVIGADVVESGGACTSQLVHRKSTVVLSDPLGERVLLDAATGRPMVFGTCDLWRNSGC